MSLYALVPLISCILCAVLAALLFARDSGVRANRLAARMMGLSAFWAFCEVLWNQQSDPEVALRLVRFSALGWVFLPPTVLQLFVELSGEGWPRLRPAVRFSYVLAWVWLPITWFTPWMHSGVEQHSWGWAYTVGPAYPPFYALLTACILCGFWIGGSTVTRSPSEGERSQARWYSVALVIAMLVSSLTDILLPMAGIQVPRFGTASLALVGVAIFWSFQRYGYSLLAPGSFANEILATLPEGVGLLRLDGRVRNGNAKLAALLGVPPDELSGLQLSDRLSEPIPSELSGERECDLVPLGGRARTVALASRALHDRQGLRIGTVVVVRDLTELVVLRERLHLSGRLAAVGELAAGIAHEINNPLAFVRANLALLRQHWSSIEDELEKLGGLREEGVALLGEGEELLDESLEGVDRASAIIRDVRGLAHGGHRERQLADLNELIEGVLRIAGPHLRSKAELDRQLGELPAVRCAPQELQQVFLNLVMNAVQAIDDERGRICVATRRENDSVVVSVEDSGCGIDPAIRERIFDPFFTTKHVGEGTGLGLGIAYGIVRQHGGDIFVESEPGRGTRFSVHLPVATDTIDAS